METHEIAGWFLLISLLFPRFMLLIAWATNSIPFNTTPFAADVILSILFPRILILIYIYGCQGLSGWFWVHLIAMGIAYTWHIINFESNMERLKSMSR